MGMLVMSRYLVKASLKVHATESRLNACHSFGPPGLAIKINHEIAMTCSEASLGARGYEVSHISLILGLISGTTLIPCAKLNDFPTPYPVLSDQNILYAINFPPKYPISRFFYLNILYP